MKWSPPKTIAFLKVRRSTPPQPDFAPLKGRWKKSLKNHAAKALFAEKLLSSSKPRPLIFIKSSHNSLIDLIERSAPPTTPWKRIKDLFFTVLFLVATSLLVYASFELTLVKTAKAQSTTSAFTRSAIVRIERKTNDRSYALSFLKELRAQNQTRLNEIKVQIKNGQSPPIKFFQEYKLRQDFLDRFILQIEKFEGTHLKEYSYLALLKMAKIESTSAPSSVPLWKFMNSLAVAIKTLPERNENLMEFIEGYMNFSSISQPLNPNEYLSQRDYTDGTNSEKAQGVDSEAAGDFVETQLQRINVERAAQLKEQIFELRRPILKDVTQEIQEKEISKARLDDWRRLSTEDESINKF